MTLALTLMLAVAAPPRLAAAVSKQHCERELTTAPEKGNAFVVSGFTVAKDGVTVSWTVVGRLDGGRFTAGATTETEVVQLVSRNGKLAAAPAKGAHISIATAIAAVQEKSVEAQDPHEEIGFKRSLAQLEAMRGRWR